jgi:hypothetical protein
MSALCQKQTFFAAVKKRIEQIGPQVVARKEQKLSVDWVW